VLLFLTGVQFFDRCAIWLAVAWGAQSGKGKYGDEKKVSLMRKMLSDEMLEGSKQRRMVFVYYVLGGVP
jgi:hypothetical protein